MIEERDIIPEQQKRFDDCHVYPRAYCSILKIFSIIKNKCWTFHLCSLKTGYIEQITLFSLISQALKLETLALVTSYQLSTE